MEMMKRLIFAVAFMLTAQGVVYAQDEEITEEDLVRYAEMMDSIEVLKERVETTIKDMVSNTEEITGARYNDLYRFSSNDAKLTELEATPGERAFLSKIDHVKDSMTTEIKTVFTSLAKDYVGGTAYNRITKALKSDAELKERYQAIYDDLRKEENEETGESGN